MGRRSIVKEVVAHQGRDLAWVAERAGLKYFTVVNVELGRTAPPAGYYERLAQVLDVPADLLRPADGRTALAS